MNFIKRLKLILKLADELYKKLFGNFCKKVRKADGLSSHRGNSIRHDNLGGNYIFWKERI